MKTFQKSMFVSALATAMLGLSTQASANFWDSIKKTTGELAENVKDVAKDVGKGVKSTVASVKEATKIETGVVYKGYSEDFKHIRELMYSGQGSQVFSLYEQAKKAGIKPTDTAKQLPEINFESDSLAVLNRLEFATLSLDMGKPETSEKMLLQARDILNQPSGQSETEDMLEKGAYLAGEFFTGNEELQPYSPPGYEKVLMMNYQALSYLLNGKEKAYNATRAAIDLQNQEFEQFRAKQAEIEKELAAKKEEKNLGLELPDVSTLFSKFYKKYDQQAETVPSAYVNPFASYLSGVVMEFDAYANASSVDDARRSYTKALSLNQDSLVIQKALTDLERVERSQSGKMDPNDRLLQLVVADGFVPEKKVVVNILPVLNTALTIQHPIVEPIESKVATIIVQDRKGKILAKTSKIADLSAIALRHQKDNENTRHLRSLVNVIRGFVEQQALNGLIPGGQFLGVVRDAHAHPDTRSWASLPSSFYGARLNLPNKIKKVTISSYDKTGKRLATTKVDLNKHHNFVYVRSIDDKLTATPSKPLWVDNVSQSKGKI